MTITIREAAVDSAEAAKQMRLQGANRIELNSHLHLGGLTPDTRTIIDTLIAITDVPVVIMVRPRAGNFAYNENELQQMQETLQQIADLGGQFVTFGVVRNHQLDYEAMSLLIRHAHALDLQVVMHMAFDDIEQEHQPQAMYWLAEHGVKRILMHGGPLSESISHTLSHIQTLVNMAPNHITILPGGGLTAENAQRIASALGVHEVHGSQIV
ncbi:copper resistance protein [Leuconostoc carnosum]|uniref:copper homeostasis protein CutC n=1 Tax=Leuconostoc carnosum TaxID=1252 RepID=UPI00123A03D3|nr:copper homeostasis protein CutC [Leuconostoc carnosum]KAA8362373.1 copper resistance protein [Leuconostoc carnosum]KAA8366922.1 copper resistance protein [Leuconostoc carnosum]KAA8368034.1 copper resistance protein [Leuconostoc carnosum]KAA8373293.1 copper resistance protein [Leuconostoc carnosum]KAA8381225.1 copper resistance protein [Leuconostoc carnosum]